MNLIKPTKLKKGDTIAIIATSGEVDIKKIKKAVKFFENLGFKVKLGKHIKKSINYLAGSDEERLEDIHNAFLDNEVKAIICARGGYGAIRLVNKINYDIIKNNPKIFCGYSDITALSAMILKNTGLITFSGAMAQSDFAQDEPNEFTINSFFETLCEGYCELTTDKKTKASCEGILFGGNLATLASLCGIDFIPDNKFIFFAEDIGEPAYKIDRYFTQLLNIEKFRKNISAIVLGDFLDVDDEKFLNDFFKNLAKELNIPVVEKFPISHSKIKATVPYGAVAKIENETIKIEDFMA